MKKGLLGGSLRVVHQEQPRGGPFQCCTLVWISVASVSRDLRRPGPHAWLTRLLDAGETHALTRPAAQRYAAIATELIVVAGRPSLPFSAAHLDRTPSSWPTTAKRPRRNQWARGA